MNTEDSFSKRLCPFWWFTRFIVLSLILWSATTEAIFLFSGFSNLMEKEQFIFGFTLIFVTLIELCKLFLGTYFFRFLTHGWLKLGWRYILSFTIILPLSSLVYFASVYLSVNGAPHIVDFLKNQSLAKVKHVNLDSIHLHYDSLITKVEIEKQKAREIKWQGITTNHATILLQQYETRILQLEDTRTMELKRAYHQKEFDLEQFNLESKYWGGWLAKFGGISEALTLLFVFFLEVYNRANELEKVNDSRKQNGRLITKPATVDENLIAYEGKTYTESRFKDWIKKTKYRALNNKTETSRVKNQIRHQDLSRVLNIHETGNEKSIS